MEVKVRVIYPQDKVLEFEAEQRDDIFKLLEECWSFLNRKDEPNYFLDKYKARNSMVGDIYQVTLNNATRYFICDSVGFKEVNKDFVEQWEKIPYLKRMLGIDFAIRMGAIKSESIVVTAEDLKNEKPCPKCGKMIEKTNSDHIHCTCGVELKVVGNDKNWVWEWF